MSVLSNVDLTKELKRSKNVGIYPLTYKNIKGSTYNLTASNYAWSINSEKSLVKGNKIVIPSKDSALIVTKEVIWVSKKMCGSYHSKVSIVSKGGGHIGTTLDPDWSGHSLITVHNHSDKDLVIDVDSTFVSIMFYYLNKRSSAQQDNHTSQLNYLYKFIDRKNISEEASKFLEEPWKSQSSNIIYKMKTEPDSDYNELVEKSKLSKYGINKKLRIFYIVLGALLIFPLIGTFYFQEGSVIQEISKYISFVLFSGVAGVIGKEVYEIIK